jgi:DNA-binding Xre family transcriptional regulator
MVFLKGGARMISYKPLWHTLIEKGVKKMELVKLTGMSSGTLAKLNNEKNVALDVIERICLALDCSVQDVVEIKKDPGD